MKQFQISRAKQQVKADSLWRDAWYGRQLYVLLKNVICNNTHDNGNNLVTFLQLNASPQPAAIKLSIQPVSVSS